MRLTRDLSGTELDKVADSAQCFVTRQKGSHMRLTTLIPSEHHITIPKADPLRVGTLGAILDAVANHVGISRDDLLTVLQS